MTFFKSEALQFCDCSAFFVDDVFGRKNGYAMKKEATAAAKQEAQPYFDEMSAMGDLALIKTDTAPSAEQLKNMSVKFNGGA